MRGPFTPIACFALLETARFVPSVERPSLVTSYVRRKTEEQHGRARAAEIVAVAAIVLVLAAAGTALASHGQSRRAPSTKAPKGISTARCLNSFDPACGPLHWDPAPSPNQPTETSVTPANARVVAGHPVTFDARATDPDARIACHWILYGDETSALIPAIAMQRQYGRWDTPAREAGTFSTTYTHTYAKPGTYRVQFGARSGDGCSNDYSPYGGESVSTATITVAAS